MSDKPRFSIGDRVLYVTFDAVSSCIPCPDCGGTLFFTAVLFDGSQQTLSCPTCDWGFEGSHGYLRTYKYQPRIVETVVQGVERDGASFAYRTEASWHCDNADLFALSEAEAASARVVQKVATAEKEERDRVLHKEKDTKTWAWHVSYHRREAKRHRDQVEYHEGKLAVANGRAKTPASTPSQPERADR